MPAPLPIPTRTRHSPLTPARTSITGGLTPVVAKSAVPPSDHGARASRQRRGSYSWLAAPPASAAAWRITPLPRAGGRPAAAACPAAAAASSPAPRAIRPWSSRRHGPISNAARHSTPGLASSGSRPLTGMET